MVSSVESPVESRLGRSPVRSLLKRVLGRGDDATIRRNAFFAYSTRIANAGILFLSQIILARWMGEFEYGIYVLAWTWVQILGGVASLGFSVSVLRFVPEYRAAGNLRKLRGMLLASRGISIAAATLIALAGAAVVLALGDRIESYFVAPIVLGFICLPMFALTDVQDGIARSYDWIDVALLPPYVWRPLLLVIFLVGAWLMGAPATAEAAIYCTIAATWLSAMIQFTVLQRRLDRNIPERGHAFEVGNWVRMSFPMLMTDSFHLLMTNTDVVVLSYFTTPDQVGLYYAAAKVLALVSIAFFAVQAAAGHQYSTLYANGDREALTAFINYASRWSFWLSLASAVGILAAGYPALWLFGPNFTAAYPVMFILAVGVLARASVGPVERLLNMIGEQRSCAWIFFLSLVLNVVLNILAIPFFGIYGAASATSLALIAQSFLLDRRVRKRLGVGAFFLSSGAASKGPLAVAKN